MQSSCEILSHGAHRHPHARLVAITEKSSTPRGSASNRAFTLIEIMVVVGVMAIILGIGVPSLIMSLKKQGMRKAVNDIIDVCSAARARAILSGSQTEVMFYPMERRFSFSGAPASVPADSDAAATSPRPAAIGTSGQLPDDITIEMLDINLLEYRESEWARIRFYPNGTSDEMTLVLRSPKNEWLKLSLEVTTGIVTPEPIR